MYVIKYAAASCCGLIPSATADAGAGCGGETEVVEAAGGGSKAQQPPNRTGDAPRTAALSLYQAAADPPVLEGSKAQPPHRRGGNLHLCVRTGPV